MASSIAGGQKGPPPDTSVKPRLVRPSARAFAFRITCAPGARGSGRPPAAAAPCAASPTAPASRSQQQGGWVASAAVMTSVRLSSCQRTDVMTDKLTIALPQSMASRPH